ncbi:MAG: acetoacetyl-CoA synthetase, partial [Porticoccaceae bacterium]
MIDNIKQPLWQPSVGRINASNLKRFGEQIEHKLGLSFDDYQQLHRWSVEQPKLFWEQV